MRYWQLILLICGLGLVMDCQSATPPVISSWRALNYPQPLADESGAYYYSFPLDNGSHAHLVVVDMKSGKWRIRPLISSLTKPTSELAIESHASAAINGGFFNLSDGDSTSYIVINGKEAANPRKNKALVENPRLAPFLETIYKRTEVRFLKDEKGKSVIQIAPHNAPLESNTVLVDSLQAGPQLLPVLRQEEEAFVRQEENGNEVDSIGCKKTAARSAFGITDDGYAMFIAIAGKGQEEFACGLTLEQLAQLLKDLGCARAVNLDGGASTTLFVRLLPDKGNAALLPAAGATVCAKTPETKVKSVLVLERLTDRQR